MKKAFEVTGNLGAILGVVVCGVSGALRAIGNFHIGGYEAMTLFNVGVGLMVFALLMKVESRRSD